MTIAHKKISAAADTGDASLVQASDWNDEHGYAAGAFVIVGIANFQVIAGAVQYGNGVPNYIPSLMTRLAAGHWKFTADKTVFEAASVLPGHQITYYPKISVRPRGALTAGFYFTVYAAVSDIHVELWNSSDAYVDPNVRCDITVELFARVTAVAP